MSVWLNTLKREGGVNLALVILASIVVLAVGYKLLYATTQVLIHFGAYAMSDGYRTHAERFGGFEGYISTQLAPRVKHIFLSQWRSTTVLSALIGTALYAATKLVRSKAVMRILVGASVAAWILWNKGIYFIYDWFWSILQALMFLLCVVALLYVYRKVIPILRETP